MNVLLDLILLGVMVFFVVLGVRRGLVRSAVHFVGSLAAAFLASALGGGLARWLFDAFFRQRLTEKIAETIETAGMDSLNRGVRELMDHLPDFLQRAMEERGVTVSSLEGMLAHRTGEASQLVTDALAPVFVGLLKVLAVLLLFFLFSILVRVIADLVSGIFRLPILHQVDLILGGVFGLLLAFVVVWVIVSALQVFVPMLDGNARADLEILLNNSQIAGWIVRGNPLAFLFG